MKHFIKRWWDEFTLVAFPAAGLAFGLVSPHPLRLVIIVANSILLTYALTFLATRSYCERLVADRAAEFLKLTDTLIKTQRSSRRTVKSLQELQAIYFEINSGLRERLNEFDRREREKNSPPE